MRVIIFGHLQVTKINSPVIKYSINRSIDFQFKHASLKIIYGFSYRICSDYSNILIQTLTVST
jgi:hypothetical protein